MSTRTVPVIWQPDTRHRTRSGKVEPREFEWICSLLSDIEVTHEFDGNFEHIATNPLVVLEGFDYDPDEVTSYLRRLKHQGNHVGLIHIGDEFERASLTPYQEVDFIFRNYWRSEADRYEHCHYLPLGPNCPTRFLSRPPLEGRPYRWSFAGQRKGSRQTLIEMAETLPEGQLVVNEEFNSGLDKKEYGQLLSDTKIAFCPRGWFSVESYRMYEALEAGAIPLVEDDSGWGLIREHARPSALKNALRGGTSYWMDLARRSRPPRSYWLNVYGPSFPCPRIYRWENLPDVLENIDAQEVGAAVQSWWQNYKTTLGQDLAVRLQFRDANVTERTVLQSRRASHTLAPSILDF